MSEQGHFAAWLPPSVQRAQAFEDIAERRVARAAERERADRAEAAAERGLEAYRAAAESRGDVVSALAIARGEGVGRSVQDVFADALAASEREDLRSAARDRNQEYVGSREPSIGRSDWPGSAYEAESQIRRAQDLHRDLVGYLARRSYPDAADAARAKSTGSVSRSARHEPVIYR